MQLSSASSAHQNCVKVVKEVTQSLVGRQQLLRTGGIQKQVVC